MKKFLSLLSIAALAIAVTSCSSSSKDKYQEQAYQFFVEWDSESSSISSSNVELQQLFNDLKKDVEIWNRNNAASYIVKYETAEELAGYDKVAVENMGIFLTKFKSWKEKEYGDKLKNFSYYGKGSFKVIYKVHVQSLVGGTKELADPIEVSFEYINELT